MAGRVRGPDLLAKYFPLGGEAAAAGGRGLGMVIEPVSAAAGFGSGSSGEVDDDEVPVGGESEDIIPAGAAAAAAGGGGGGGEDDAIIGRRLLAPAGGGGGGGGARSRFGAAAEPAPPAAPVAGVKRPLAKREANAAAAGAAVLFPDRPLAKRIITIPEPAAAAAMEEEAALINPNSVHPIADLTPAQINGLAHADNLHDAANGYRNRTPPRADEVRAALFRTFKRRNRCPLATADIASCLTQQLGDGVLQSRIEDSTMAWFEMMINYLQQPSPNAKATYTEILAMAEGVQEEALGKRNEYDTFKILPVTGSRVKTYTAAQKEQVTKFILNFLLGTDVAPTYMTFDAAPKTVGKLFAGHPTVCGLIMPQNVGDSASTSFIQLGKEPNLYIFPFTDPADTSVFYSKRNVLSQDLLRTFYKDNGFSAKFPFKFSFGIQSVAEPAQSVSVSYQDGGYKQGPSLDYLIDLMLAAQGGVPFGNIKPTSACLQIGQIIDNNPNINARVRETLGGIFMDIKREGDQDVCDALHSLLILAGFIDEGKYVILVTIDRLCSLLARLLGIPCIYHYGDELTLYKNTQTDRGLTPVQKAEFIAQKENKFIAAYGGLVDAYSDRAKLLSFLCSFGPHMAEEAGSIDRLRRNRIVDMFNKLKAFYDFLGLPATEATVNAAIAAKRAAERGALTPAKEKFIRISSFLETVNAAGYDTVFLSGLLPNISPDVQAFNRASDYSFLNYSADDFSDLATAKSKIDGLIGRDKSLRDVENYDRMLAGPEGYNILLKGITSTFFDQGHAEAAFTELQYKPVATAAISDARIIQARQEIAFFEQESVEVAALVGLTIAILDRKKALRGIRERAIAASTDLRTAFRASMRAVPVVKAQLPIERCPGQGGGAYVQSGGAVVPQHIERFTEICGKAAQFINSEILKSFPLVFQRYAMQSFVDNLSQVYEKAREEVGGEDEEDDKNHTILKEKVEQLARSKELLKYARLEPGVLAEFIEAYDDIIDSSTMRVKDDNIDETEHAPHLSGLIRRMATPDAAGNMLYNITIENIVANASASDASALLTELYTLWATRDLGQAEDNTHAMITLLLDPYSNDNQEAVDAAIAAKDAYFSGKGAENEKYQRVKRGCAAVGKCAGVDEDDDEEDVVVEDPLCTLPADDVHLINLTGLKMGYPLLMSNSKAIGSSPVRTSFLQKLLIDDLKCGIYSRVPMYSLITFAYINDLLNGTLSKNQSLITSILSPTVFASSFKISNPTHWETLSLQLIPIILLGIDDGRLSKQAIWLVLPRRGGARRNRTRRHRRSRRRGHTTRRRSN